MAGTLLISFGDVFNYSGNTFVFLAESIEKKIIYAGRVLDPENSVRLEKFCEKQQYKSNYNPDSTAYSFVVLKTKAFQNCAAWFNKPDIEGETANMRPQHLKLDKEDLKEIKKIILDGAFPQELKERLKQIT